MKSNHNQSLQQFFDNFVAKNSKHLENMNNPEIRIVIKAKSNDGLYYKGEFCHHAFNNADGYHIGVANDFQSLGSSLVEKLDLSSFDG